MLLLSLLLSLLPNSYPFSSESIECHPRKLLYVFMSKTRVPLSMCTSPQCRTVAIIFVCTVATSQIRSGTFQLDQAHFKEKTEMLTKLSADWYCRWLLCIKAADQSDNCKVQYVTEKSVSRFRCLCSLVAPYMLLYVYMPLVAPYMLPVNL